MKITIPEEYRGRFTDDAEKMWIRVKGQERCDVKEFATVFVSRWKDGGLLLMNKKEYEQFVATLDGTEQGGMTRFIKAGIEPVAMVNGAIEVSEGLAERLQDGERTFGSLALGTTVF